MQWFPCDDARMSEGLAAEQPPPGKAGFGSVAFTLDSQFRPYGNIQILNLGPMLVENVGTVKKIAQNEEAAYRIGIALS